MFGVSVAWCLGQGSIFWLSTYKIQTGESKCCKCGACFFKELIWCLTLLFFQSVLVGGSKSSV